MKKNSKKTISKFIAIVLILGTLACCTNNKEVTESKDNILKESEHSPETVILRFCWWGGDIRHDLTKQALDAYSKENPNIIFEPLPSTWSGYFEKLSTAAAGGTMPDIVQMDYLYIETYAENGSLANLNPYIENNTIDVTSIDEKVYNSGHVKGILAGIPYATSIYSLVYNPDIIEEAGLEGLSSNWTWDDMIQMSTLVHEKTGKYGFNFDIDDVNGLRYWVRQYGFDLFNEDGTALGFTDTTIIEELLDFHYQLLMSGSVPTPEETLKYDMLDKFEKPLATKEQAGGVAWSNYPITLEPVNDTLKLEIPPTKENSQPALWSKPSGFLSVSQISKNKTEAAKFVDWFINSTSCYDIIGGERGVPVNSNIREHLKPNLTNSEKKVFDYIDYATNYVGDLPKPDPNGTSEINEILIKYKKKIQYGVISSKEAAQNFYDETNAVLAKNKSN